MEENHFEKINFKKKSSIKIGPEVDVLIIEKIADYSEYQIIGESNNILVSNTPPNFAKLGKSFDYIEEKDGKLYVGCATKSGKLFNYAKKNDLANFEFLGNLPGNLGGLIKMNAGLKEWEIFNYIDSIKTKDGYVKKEDIEYGYRFTNIDTIVYELVFNITKGYSKQMNELFKSMRANQPKTSSAGSCFKNPKGDSAGRLIEQAGLKGFSKNGMSFSNIHANFLVNDGDGTFEDAIYLINLAKERVKKEFEVELQTEIIIF